MAVLSVPPLDITYPTLGYQLKNFIEERCVFGPGPLQGQPARLDPEKFGLLCRLYELNPKGHRLAGMRRFQRCGVELRKGVAKTEFGVWVVFCELHPDSPVRFNGFDPDHLVEVDGSWVRDGLAEGRPIESPYIPMVAVTSDQVERLAYGVLKYIIEECPDSDLFYPSKERIVRLSSSGREDGCAEAVANAPGSADGARTTCQHFDEPHRLFLPRIREAHETMMQNMHKRQVDEPWTLYTSTAGQPGQGSIQEDVRAEAEDIAEGKLDDPTLFFFARWAGEEHDDLSTVEKRMAAVADATGPVGEWGRGQFERIARDYDRKGVDRAYWERVYLNRWRKAGSQAFDMIKVGDLETNEDIPEGAFITAGFDGARFRDSTAIVITEIETGRQKLLGIWERPENVDEWEVPGLEVVELVDDMMAKYEVWRMYCDPPYWYETVASWAAKYPDRVIEWNTGGGSYRKMSDAIRTYVDAIDTNIIAYPEPKRDTLFRHMSNAGRRELSQVDDQGQPLWLMQKMDGRLGDKFDAAMAAVLSWQACIDARREGAKPRPKAWLPRRIY